MPFWTKAGAGAGVWDFKEKEGSLQEYEKEQMVGKQVFAGPCRNSETQIGILTNRLCQVSPCLHT